MRSRASCRDVSGVHDLGSGLIKSATRIGPLSNKGSLRRLPIFEGSFSLSQSGVPKKEKSVRKMERNEEYENNENERGKSESSKMSR
jgi:hypothetical protein